MRNMRLWVHWVVAASGASLAFYIGSMLVGFPYRNYGVGIFGLRDWLTATMFAELVGTLFAPPSYRRIARLIFVSIPISVSFAMLIYYLVCGSQEGMAVSSVAQSLVGGLVAWIFLKKIIISF